MGLAARLMVVSIPLPGKLNMLPSKVFVFIFLRRENIEATLFSRWLEIKSSSTEVSRLQGG
jgi:hypothetical protein